MVVPQAVGLACASGLLASLPQNKGHGNLGDLVKTIVADTPQESAEPSRVFSSAATSNVSPAVLGTVESLNVNVGHDKWDKVNGRLAHCLSVGSILKAELPIVRTNRDGMPIVTR